MKNQRLRKVLKSPNKDESRRNIGLVSNFNSQQQSTTLTRWCSGWHRSRRRHSGHHHHLRRRLRNERRRRRRWWSVLLNYYNYRKVIAKKDVPTNSSSTTPQIIAKEMLVLDWLTSKLATPLEIGIFTVSCRGRRSLAISPLLNAFSHSTYSNNAKTNQRGRY